MPAQPEPYKTLSGKMRTLEEELRQIRNRLSSTGIVPDGTGGFAMADNSLAPTWLQGAVVPWLVDETFQMSGQTIPSTSWSFPISVTSPAPAPGGFSRVLIAATAQAGAVNTTGSVDYLFAAPTIASYGFPGFAHYVPAGGYNTAVSTYNLLLGAVESVDFKAGVKSSLAPWSGSDLTVRLCASLLWIR